MSTESGLLLVIAFVEAFSALIVSLFGYRSNKRLAELKSSYDKKAESHRSNLESKNYISRARFDMEFEVYGRLSRSFFDLNKDVCTMIPPRLIGVSDDAGEQYEREKGYFNSAAKSLGIAQDSLHYNGAFISEYLFDKYDEVLQLCDLQITLFALHLNKTDRHRLQFEDYDRSIDINNKIRDLQRDVRRHLISLPQKVV
ncbi:MAG: hypothetical protein LBP28_08285 [Coriobacteriales bacterium]|nr:hypothetical protein [Coriobacteriales bacterium]